MLMTTRMHPHQHHHNRPPPTAYPPLAPPQQQQEKRMRMTTGGEPSATAPAATSPPMPSLPQLTAFSPFLFPPAPPPPPQVTSLFTRLPFMPPPHASHFPFAQFPPGSAPAPAPLPTILQPLPNLQSLQAKILAQQQQQLGGMVPQPFTSSAHALPAESPVNATTVVQNSLISPKHAKTMKVPISPSSAAAAAAAAKKKKRESEVTRRTNLNDLVTVVEQAVLLDMNRMDRFADKVTVLECTARMLHEKYGLQDPSELDYESDSSNASDEKIDLSSSNLDRNTKKTLRERQRRRSMNKHLHALRRMLKVDETKDKKAVLHAVIDFLNEKRIEREQQPQQQGPSSSSSSARASPLM